MPRTDSRILRFVDEVVPLMTRALIRERQESGVYGGWKQTPIQHVILTNDIVHKSLKVHTQCGVTFKVDPSELVIEDNDVDVGGPTTTMKCDDEEFELKISL